MTPCHPIKPLLICPTCARYSPGLPHDAHFREHTVCMDATVCAVGGTCNLHKPKEIPVPP